MAIDEVLLERAISERMGHFRLYQWSAPTITLGYFQDYQPETIPEEMKSLDVVRRLTGGGAILHHHELTYSCSLPSENRWQESPSDLYSEIHQVIRDALARQGFACEFRGVSKSFPAGEPFLCYSRGDERDLVHGSHKVVGSAQRRRKGAILQHGSILIGRSQFAPQFPGVHELGLKGQDLNVSELCEEIVQVMFSLFENCLKTAQLPVALRPSVDALVQDKYRYAGRRFESSKGSRSGL
jgi:lipoate-protein ligase A